MDDAPAVDRQQRVRLLVREAARLDLDEHGHAAALHDQVDLAHRRFHASAEHAIELRAQEQLRPQLAGAQEVQAEQVGPPDGAHRPLFVPVVREKLPGPSARHVGAGRGITRRQGASGCCLELDEVDLHLVAGPQAHGVAPQHH